MIKYFSRNNIERKVLYWFIVVKEDMVIDRNGMVEGIGDLLITLYL